ncbi:MAG TPA: toll/interleukin-1 receptor domain-containing protein, partial [Gammaproteobacteria bacterium]|nr:toll/interleukin-1 receptor domain-containing protein [Gammaproteobacteria bacterium]
MEPQPTSSYHQAIPDYLAFISYRHADNTDEDRQWATWLHQQLEVYDIPADLIGTTNLRGETIPERIYPVFRDEVSLPADANLSSSITQALDRTRFLIVLCSPRAVQSYYVNQEILHFKQTGKQDRIIAAMVYGEPNASIDDAKQEDPEHARTLECFPEALQYHLNNEGELDKTAPTEPVA